MGKKIKKTVIQPPAKKDLPGIMHKLALAQAELKRIEADIEKKVIKVRETKAQVINEQQSIITEATGLLNAYVLNNPEEFEKKRSMNLAHGTIGLRVGTPKVKYERGFAKKALGLIKTLGLDFIRTKEEVDKEKIIASRQDSDIMEKLNQCGIMVVQEESFYCEPKEEVIETN